MEGQALGCVSDGLTGSLASHPDKLQPLFQLQCTASHFKHASGLQAEFPAHAVESFSSKQDSFSAFFLPGKSSNSFEMMIQQRSWARLISQSGLMCGESLSGSRVTRVGQCWSMQPSPFRQV